MDTDHWLTVNDNCTISYGGKTSKVDVEKKNIKTTDRPYWECADGSNITPGSVVVAQNPYGEDHAWIYMGEFDSKNDVVSYLKSIGVSESLINSKYTIKAGKNKVKEDYETGTIKINKTAEDGIISGREFNISYTYNGKSLAETDKTNAKGIAVFDDLRVG